MRESETEREKKGSNAARNPALLFFVVLGTRERKQQGTNIGIPSKDVFSGKLVL